MRPSRLVAGLVAVSAACTFALTGTASSAIGPHFAALGDSYASGVGTGTYLPESGGCLRSPEAYPALFARTQSVGRFDFLACNGADTAAVRNSQIKAVGEETDLVTLSVGGRDVGYDKVLTTCVLGTDAQCAAAVDQAEAFVNSRLPTLLDETYGQLVQAAPRARILVMGYPRLFELGECGHLGLSEGKRQRLNQGADTLDHVIAERAEQAGLTYVDVRDYFAGHGVCGQQQAWINGLTRPEIESFHPTADGHREGYLPALTDNLPLAPKPAAVPGHHPVTH